MTKKSNTKEFIEKAKRVHVDEYDYSKVKYVNNHTKVCIICNSCGREFWQTPANHLSGYGCEICNRKKHALKITSNTQEFIEKARKVHGDKYDYSKVDYKRKDKKIIIICHEKDENGIEHGEFEQTPNNHLTGYGCKKCAGIERLTIEEFIKRSNKVHNFKYDYSNSVYINNRTKLDILCPKHGIFPQTPDSHMRGEGCPFCNQSKLEMEISSFLTENKIKHIYQADKENTFEWLGQQSLDFYLPDYNVAIECQGIQHFEPVDIFGGDEEFENIQKRDARKKKLCKQYGVKLLYFTSNKILENRVVYDKFFTNKFNLLENVKNGKI